MAITLTERRILNGVEHLMLTDDSDPMDILIHVVPVPAIAIWADLLGVDDDTALVAIMNRSDPPDPEDSTDGRNGWTVLYERLIERWTTEKSTDPSELVDLDHPSRDAMAVLQTQALQEDVQRSVRPQLPIPQGPTELKVHAALNEVRPQVAMEREAFRDSMSQLEA